MKAFYVVTVLLFVILSNNFFGQNSVSQKNVCTSKSSKVSPKRKPLPKLSKLDSLLNEREFRIEEDEITRDVDLELAKLSYAPKVVVKKQNDGLAFYYFKNLNNREIEVIKQKLENDFNIESFDINPKTMNCKVDFKNDASEENKYAFFREFGYEGIIYQY